MSRINIKLIKGRTPGSPVRLDVKLQVKLKKQTDEFTKKDSLSYC